MPEPPPMPTTVPTFSNSMTAPSGPARSLMASPTGREASSAVDLPTTWKMIVRVPFVGVGVRDGQRQALARLVDAEDHELAGADAARDRGSFDGERDHVPLRELLPVDD